MNSSNQSGIPSNSTLFWYLYYNQIASSINYYFAISMVPVGVILNGLAFLIASRKSLNKTNMGFFIRSLSTSNLVTLLFSLFFMQSRLLFNFDFYTYSDVSCRFIMYTRRSIRVLSPMIETLFTVDRFLAVMFPKKFEFLKKNRNVLLSILVIVAIDLISNTLNAFNHVEEISTQFVDSNGLTRMYSKKICTSSDAISFTSDVILIFMRVLIPLAVMGSLNFLICRKLVTSRQSIHSSGSASIKANKDRQFTKNLVLMNVAFIAFNLPKAITYFVKDIIHESVFNEGPFNAEEAKLTMYWYITFNISTFYYVIYFPLNVYFNKLFRREVLATICHVPHNHISSDTFSATRKTSNTK
jgi:hypothetical protein